MNDNDYRNCIWKEFEQGVLSNADFVKQSVSFGGAFNTGLNALFYLDSIRSVAMGEKTIGQGIGEIAGGALSTRAFNKHLVPKIKSGLTKGLGAKAGSVTGSIANFIGEGLAYSPGMSAGGYLGKKVIPTTITRYKPPMGQQGTQPASAPEFSTKVNRRSTH